MSEGKKVPKIRFPGFEGEWEEKEFGSLFLERREKTKTENEDQLISCAINGLFLNSELFAHFRGSSTIGYLKIKKNDLILSAQNLHLGNANVNLRFDHGIISPAYKVFDLVGCDPLFIHAWVKQEDTKQFFLAATTEGASACRKNIEWQKLNRQTINVPELKEQKAIGDFLHDIDDSIDLLQLELNKLKELRKSLLQKMFPKEGESVPDIRFPGFCSSWKQKTIGSLIENGTIIAQSDGNHGELYPRTEEFVETGIPYVTASNISENGEDIDFSRTKYLTEDRAHQFRKGVAINGDVLLAHNATVGPSLLLRTEFEYVILSTTLTQYRLDKSKMDSNFFLQIIRSNRFQSQLTSRMKQSTRNQVPILMQRQLTINFPLDMEEQQAIGGFLKTLDDRICVQLHELNKWKELKKGLLQQMFV